MRGAAVGLALMIRRHQHATNVNLGDVREQRWEWQINKAALQGVQHVLDVREQLSLVLRVVEVRRPPHEAGAPRLRVAVEDIVSVDVVGLAARAVVHGHVVDGDADHVSSCG